MAKKSTLNAALAVMALLLIVGGVGLFWVAWRGVRVLQKEAVSGAASATGTAATLAGKTDYVGTWTNGFETLTIDPSGQGDWSETRSGAKTDVHGTVSFGKNEIVLDAVVTKKKLHLDTPPHANKNGTNAMTVDGVELEKK
ncbi:MAG TPA: hypothetical protein VGH28_01195 [Polyangiaceae bacterium]|jgi:hypothetical protein